VQKFPRVSSLLNIFSVLQCVTVCCSVLQCVAVCCSAKIPKSELATKCPVYTKTTELTFVKFTSVATGWQKCNRCLYVQVTFLKVQVTFLKVQATFLKVQVTFLKVQVTFLKVQVTFRKRAIKYRALLRKQPIKIRHSMRLRHAVASTKAMFLFLLESFLSLFLFFLFFF